MQLTAAVTIAAGSFMQAAAAQSSCEFTASSPDGERYQITLVRNAIDATKRFI
jgi:hypothetical protein